MDKPLRYARAFELFNGPRVDRTPLLKLLFPVFYSSLQSLVSRIYDLHRTIKRISQREITRA